MIKSLKVKNLNKFMSFNINFNRDINVFTGKNGSGKTSVLKLIWYLYSGNIEHTIPELYFDFVELETDELFISINIDRSEEPQIRVRVDQDDNSEEIELPLKAYRRNMGDFEGFNRLVAKKNGSSVFFPTFRRIEGGFTINQQPIHRPFIHRSDIQDSMVSLSNILTVFDHDFVSSISTDDIVELLTTKYADISDYTNKLHTELSRYITSTISDYSRSEGEKEQTEEIMEAKSILSKIQHEVNRITKEREKAFKPFITLSNLIADIFEYKGIKVTENITLGEAKESISSDDLSAGEKQLLSFLCYNAFKTDSSIFIDEPEISLHVDWQRILFPTLMDQGTGNQFIIATHSPFIYSKFEDKEIILGEK